MRAGRLLFGCCAAFRKLHLTAFEWKRRKTERMRVLMLSGRCIKALRYVEARLSISEIVEPVWSRLRFGLITEFFSHQTRQKEGKEGINKEKAKQRKCSQFLIFPQSKTGLFPIYFRLFYAFSITNSSKPLQPDPPRYTTRIIGFPPSLPSHLDSIRLWLPGNYNIV